MQGEEGRASNYTANQGSLVAEFCTRRGTGEVWNIQLGRGSATY